MSTVAVADCAAMNSAFKAALRLQHLEQLRTLPLPDKWPSESERSLGAIPLIDLKNALKAWSAQSSALISTAVASRAAGGADISSAQWANAAMLTFLESTATYLRDTDMVLAAAKLARERRRESDEDALRLLAESQRDIKEIAHLWGMDFEVVCDLIPYSPDGDTFLDGPYCGLFFPLDLSKPFLGLAFKGTNSRGTMPQEIAVDASYSLTTPAPPTLFGGAVSFGIYTTLFTNFGAIHGVPFEYIKKTVDTQLTQLHVPDEQVVELHVTGHSLGGMYGTLCYAELLRQQSASTTSTTSAGPPSPQYLLRDLYTFGSARVGGVLPGGGPNFASALLEHMSIHSGHSWRIVAPHDPVTMTPPPPAWIPTDPQTFNHVDCGVRVFPNAKPEALESEVNTEPRPRILPLPSIFYHAPERYYAAIYFAATGQAPPAL